MRFFALLTLAVLGHAATLLVLNKEDATLVIVDPASGKILGTVPTGEGPHEVATDGKLAFVGNYGTGPAPGKTISVIDLASKKELRRVDVTPLQRPHGVFVSGGKLYFTAEANKIVGRYDPAANQIDWMMGTGLNSTHMVMLTKDGSKMFTSNIGSDAIAILERGTNPMNWNMTVVPVGKGPEAIEISPDEKEIWTAHSRDGGVSIIDIAAKKVTGTIDVHTKRSNRLKITPDGKLVLITDLESGELVVLDRASHKEIKRIALGKSPEGILIVPDGSRAYIAVNGDNYLAVFDLKTLTVTSRVSTGKGPDGMAWIN
jgi:YVTN family beta-propeller protein